MAGLEVGEMQGKLRTESARVELNGPIADCLVHAFIFVRPAEARAKLLARLTKEHEELSRMEAERAAKKAAATKAGDT